MKINFIAGIHGVGKTFYTNSLKDGIPAYSASDLIRKYKQIEGKKTKDIDKNQNLLLDAILELNEKEIYLDGHFCLLNENGEISEIPFKTFEELGLEKIVILYAPVEKITERLKVRDSQEYDINLLEKFQNKEIEYGKEIAEKLGIVIEIIEN